MRAERRNVTSPPDWWAAFESAARQSGLTLSEWAAEAMLARLPEPIRAKLSERTKPGRPKGATK